MLNNTTAVLLTADELVGALDALGVNFLTGGRARINSCRLTPADLLAQLAAQMDTRVQLSIIPLLLRRPEFAEVVEQVILAFAALAQVHIRRNICW